MHVEHLQQIFLALKSLIAIWPGRAVVIFTTFYRKQDNGEEEKGIRMWVDPQRSSVYSIK